jgi:DNA-binding NtrC family response regulator
MKKKILVVDDDCNFRNLVLQILEDEGYSVSTAEDGISALKALESEKCDVLLTDIRMPNMDGIELFNNVKRLYPQMPVIFLTGSAYVNAAGKCLEEGASYYFEKPVDFNLLKCVFKHILEIKDFESEINKVKEWIRENMASR